METAQETRRSVLQRGILAFGMALAGVGAPRLAAPDSGEGGNDPMPLPDDLPGPSPATAPWVVELPIPPILRPVESLHPPADPAEHYSAIGFDPVYGPLNALFQIAIKPGRHRFHPDLPEQEIWGYDGMFPGPTMIARYGQPKIVRFENQLPITHVGFGVPETTTHNHNGHQEWFSDGHPTDFLLSGDYRDHHYPIILAGGDPAEALGTLWYHDHRVDFTAQNVYRGLAGFHLHFDDVDSGDEQDPKPQALRLPSGAFDIPLLLADKAFDSSGLLYFDPFNFDGFLGDKWTVNGVIQPYLRVARRKYRFRLLDGGPSRIYQFHLSNDDPMILIATDGNLLPAPIPADRVRLGVAQRRDVIIDFSRYPIGAEIVLENRLLQINGRGPKKDLLNPGSPVLKFIVDRDAAGPEQDFSRVPATLRRMPSMDLSTAGRHQRTFEFERKEGAWAINGQFFNGAVPAFTVKRGVPEIWTLKNHGGWSHPIHIHLEEFRILLRNGAMPIPEEQGRHDVVLLEPGDEVMLYIRFRTFVGKYIMHCHNTVHEDHAMMLRFDVVS